MKRVRHFWLEIAVAGFVLVVAAAAALAPQPPDRSALPASESRSTAPSYPETPIRTGGLLP